MGNFRRLLIALLVCPLSALATTPPATTPAPTVVSHVAAINLLPVLDAKEVTPVPKASACAALASHTGPDGQPIIPPGAQLLNASMPEDEIADAVVESLSLSFAGSGLELGKDLVLLTGDLRWVPQGREQVMVATFERGPFTGFFDSRTRHLREQLVFCISGTQVCVVPR